MNQLGNGVYMYGYDPSFMHNPQAFEWNGTDFEIDQAWFELRDSKSKSLASDSSVRWIGMDRDGRQWRVPRNSKGEVLSSDEDKTIAIFPLSTGQLQPHLVRVVADTTSFSQSHGSPFIGS
jgi:hypothetical protein